MKHKKKRFVLAIIFMVVSCLMAINTSNKYWNVPDIYNGFKIDGVITFYGI